MRISDWSSDVCSSDLSLWSGGPQDADRDSAHVYLRPIQDLLLAGKNEQAQALLQKHFVAEGVGSGFGSGADDKYGCYQTLGDQIGRASCRERVCQYV